MVNKDLVAKFEAEDMYLLLRSRQAYLAIGLTSDHPVVQTIDAIRQRYVEQVGIARYFREMSSAINRARSR